MPKVSVIVPVYNVAKYLRQCMDSLVGQTLRDIEVICVDDGSTDGSGAILDEYVVKDPRVKVIHQANAGAGAARNIGLDVAAGEYLFFCDPDDWCRRGMLKAMYARAGRTQADVVVAGRIVVDGSCGRVLGSRGLHPDLWLMRQPFSPRDIADSLFTFSPNVAWDKLFRRDFVNCRNLRFQNLPRSNDVLFVNAALATAERIALVFGAWICHRQDRPDGLQRTKDRHPDCVYRALDALRTELEKRGLFEVFRVSFLDALIAAIFSNLRTFVQEENRQWSYGELKRRVAELERQIPVGELERRRSVAVRVRRILSSARIEDLPLTAPIRSGGVGRFGALPFRLREALKIMVCLLHLK